MSGARLLLPSVNDERCWKWSRKGEDGVGMRARWVSVQICGDGNVVPREE